MPPLKKICAAPDFGDDSSHSVDTRNGAFVLQVTQLKSALKPVVSLCGLCSRYVFKMKEY